MGLCEPACHHRRGCQCCPPPASLCGPPWTNLRSTPPGRGRTAVVRSQRAAVRVPLGAPQLQGMLLPAGHTRSRSSQCPRPPANQPGLACSAPLWAQSTGGAQAAQLLLLAPQGMHRPCCSALGSLSAGPPRDFEGMQEPPNGQQQQQQCPLLLTSLASNAECCR